MANNIDLTNRLVISAVLRGLSKSGDISPAGIDAVAAELRASTTVTAAWGWNDASDGLRRMADDIASGTMPG